MRLNFQRHGDAGSPLIILHGLFGSLDNWQGVSRKLGEAHGVYAVDLRNHGRSPHGNEFNYRVMAEDLIEFMADQGLDRANLLGHSLGGKAAMHFALSYGKKVEKLIVVDIAPRKYSPSHEPLFEAMLSLDLTAFSERVEMDRALAGRVPDKSVRQFLLKNVGRDENETFRWKLNLPAIYRNYEELNRAIEIEGVFEGPTMFIKGGKSDYIGEEDNGLIQRLFPCAKIETIPEAGHWVQAEAPGKLTALVLNFLE